MHRIMYLIIIFSIVSMAQEKLPGFSINGQSEQVLSFRFEPEISVLINAPSINEFNKDLPVGIILYALPNGNSTEWTVGKIIEPGDDWHFGIQNIGAQTRFLRSLVNDYNIVTVYLETDQKSWPQWKASHGNYAVLVKQLTDKVVQQFKSYNPFVILSGHSGGGRFIFSFLDAYTEIPSFVKRICFLDSNYGYDSLYGKKVSNWLKLSSDNYLSVLAYNDSEVVLNGKNIVSPEGGTWYRSRLMKDDLSKEFSFITKETEEFIIHVALNGRIKILLKKNPSNEIFHTVQVERNGFIHSVLTGSKYENIRYTYFGERAY